MSGGDHRFILALGCNVDHEKNVSRTIKLLRQEFSIDFESRHLWTEPIGIDSDKFLNCIVAGSTTRNKNGLSLLLKDIERQCGRNAQDKANNIIRMDIDMLSYDNLRIHENDWQRDYIQTLIDDYLTFKASPGLI